MGFPFIGTKIRKNQTQLRSCGVGLVGLGASTERPPVCNKFYSGRSFAVFMLAYLPVFFCLSVPVFSFAGSVRDNSQSAAGCMRKVSIEEARAAIRRFQFTTRGASSDEVVTLGTGLAWLEELAGGNPPQFAVASAKNKGYPFVFRNHTGHSVQKPHGIFISRHGENNNGENVGQLIHELGHLVGNQGVYAKFRSVVGTQRCNVSSYSMSGSLNEQFSEVFAAFVTFPELLRRNPAPACQRAWKFFSEQLFENGAERANMCMQAQRRSFSQQTPRYAQTRSYSSRSHWHRPSQSRYSYQNRRTRQQDLSRRYALHRKKYQHTSF